MQDLASLIRDDGSVVVPAGLAGEVARLLSKALVAESRSTGAPVTPTAVALLRALDEAARRPRPSGTSASTSVSKPAARPASTVEAAVSMGKSSRWVRALCSSGRIRAQRDG